MRFLKFVVVWGLLTANGAYAGITISCGSAEQSLIFQEGIDNFYLDIVERSSYGTFVGGMRRGGSGGQFGAHFRLPKRVTVAGEPAPVCRFSDTSPLLFQCTSPVFEGEGELIDAMTSQRSKVVVGKLDVSAREVEIQTFNPGTGTMESRTWLRVRYQTDAMAEEVKPKPAEPYRLEVDYPIKSCKAGEGIVTPAIESSNSP